MILVLSPNLIWVWVGGGAIAWISGFLLQFVLLLAVLALTGGRCWVSCVLLVPFAMLAPLEIFYIGRYHHPSNVQVLGSLFTTNPDETVQYLGRTIYALLIAIAAGAALATAAARSTKRTDLRWRHRSRLVFLSTLLALPCAVLISDLIRARGNFGDRLQQIGASAAAFEPHLAVGFPFGLVVRSIDFYQNWSAMRASVSELDAFRFHVSRVGGLAGRQVYVLALGESSRRDHWQMFGYERQTNPELSRIANLVPLSDMLTSWPESIAAIPLVLTRKPITSMRMSWREPSILRAMQEGGFETFWISNQLSMGSFDSPVSVYALEAQHVIFLNHDSLESGTSYDEVLLPPLRNILASNRGDLFIVLHLIGNHWHYDARYPTSFKHFVPTLSDAKDSSIAPGEKMRNSYDNSILYGDHVLAQVIEILRDSGDVAALWFESDHGETLAVPGCDVAGHGIGSRYDFQIPAFVWYSDAYKQERPQRVADLQAHASQRVLSANTFESLVDIAGLTFPGHDQAWSLASDNWQYHMRVVNADLQTDFDGAQFEGGCSIVVPPGIHLAK